MPKVRFCYELQEGANWAQDEDGNPCKAYVQVALGFDCDVTEGSETYNEVHSKLAIGVARELNINIDFIKPVSIAFYEEMHTGEDDSEFEEDEF